MTDLRGMRSCEWKVVSASVADEEGWPDAPPGPGAEWSGHDWWQLWLFRDGVPVRLLGEDGGEPEDQTLVRDWAWVRDACAEAYAMGLADARQSAPEDLR